MRRTPIPAIILSGALLLGVSACDDKQDAGAPASSPAASASNPASAVSAGSAPAAPAGSSSAGPQARAAAESALKAPSRRSDIATLQYRPALSGSAATTIHVISLKRNGTGVQLTLWAKGSNTGDGVVMLANDLSTLPHLIDPSTRTKYSADTFTDSEGKTFAVMSEATSTNTAVPGQVEIRYTVPGQVKSVQLGIDGASGSHQQVAVPLS